MTLSGSAPVPRFLAPAVTTRAFCSRSYTLILYSVGTTSIGLVCSVDIPSRTWWRCRHCGSSRFRHFQRQQHCCYRYSGAFRGPRIWVCSRCVHENCCMNLLLDTIAQITSVTSVEDIIPNKSDFASLILLVRVLIRPSVCASFLPCPLSICLSPHFWYLLSLLLRYCCYPTFIHPVWQLIFSIIRFYSSLSSPDLVLKLNSCWPSHD